MFSTVEELPKTEPRVAPAAMPTSPAVTGQMTLGNRQLAVVSFVILAMMALVASVAYLAGRLVTPSGLQTQTSQAASEDAMRPEQVFVVDAASPTGAITPSQTLPEKSVERRAPLVTESVPARPGETLPATLATALAPPSVPAAAPAPAAVVPAPAPAPRPAREMYWQVASVDRGMADVSVEYLKKNGLPAFVVNGATPTLFRVLVGPAGTPQEVAQLKAELNKLGFSPFLKQK